MNSRNTSPVSLTRDSEASSETIPSTSGYTTPEPLEDDETRVQNICFVGAGYVGGPTAAVVAYQNPNIQVSVVDKNSERIESWKSRHLPIHEPGLEDVVRIARDGIASRTHSSGSDERSMSQRSPNLIFSTDVEKCISEADIVFIAVNTPTKEYGTGAGSATNLAALESAAVTIAQFARAGAVIVEKSTVPCGTARTIQDIFAVHRPNDKFEVLSNPEFLAEGSAIRDLLCPDRILIGSSRSPSGFAAAAKLQSIYSWIDKSKILTVNTWSAELAKVVANAMLAQRISSINTISAICDKTGAEIDQVAAAIGSDSRLGSKFLKAGIGFGGSCFKKDILALTYLANSLHLPEVADYWMAVLAVNDFQKTRFLDKIVSKLNGALYGKKITVLGYTFKQNTNDTRESPAIEVIQKLAEERPSEIAVFDPGCTALEIRHSIDAFVSPAQFQNLHTYDNVYDACSGSSAILILTPWEQFKSSKLKLDSQDINLTSPTVSSIDASIPDPALARSPVPTKPAYSPTIYGELKTVSPLVEPPECPPDCQRCQTPAAAAVRPDSTLDWEKIAAGMRDPKWLFDGRNIVDSKWMATLGFRVENVGNNGHSFVR
ncbi:UDP-glucose dehydrogenase [Microthyrium microscopicum]|uniref:UDP-glucose 6-dehydrogenase n=1 Tax=Microthyrium microscopicum TaxID=703497 RepID=A0A6A6TW07_9PEZI|nr:UDP-glucose dehydrogenase [Microthyrium microscopicum]